MILAGHGRWEAAREIGLATIPVIRDFLMSEEERRAFALADNRLAELSGWDEVVLAEELQVLFDGGFELQITGFSTADLDFSLAKDDGSEDVEEVEVPAPSGTPVSRLDDKWQVGPHCLICGDARGVLEYGRRC